MISLVDLSLVFIINLDFHKTAFLSIKFHSLKLLEIHAHLATHLSCITKCSINNVAILIEKCVKVASLLF